MELAQKQQIIVVLHPYLHSACMYGKSEIVKTLLQHHANIDTPGMTPLHIACVSNRYEVVKELLKHGVNRTILHYIALFSRHAKSDVKFLKPFLTYSVVSAKDSSGDTCLHDAVNKTGINFLRGIFEEFEEVN